METILLKDQIFSYQINRKFIRSIRLHLKSKNHFTISCPHITPNFTLQNFIHQNTTWILKNSFKLHSYPQISTLKTITILNKTYKLAVSKKARDSILISDKEQTIYLFSSRLSNAHLKKILNKYLREHALFVIKKNLQILKSQYGFNYSRVSVRNQKSRYGSCSHFGNLNFNWQIIFFPFPIFRHLLLHELTHLQIKNHSKNFYHQLSIYDPDWKEHDVWLRKEGSRHFLIKP